MSPTTSDYLPIDYTHRVKRTRELCAATQSQFAELVGVSYASVNRWENGQSRPNKLAWQRITELEQSIRESGVHESENVSHAGHTSPANLDFSADPKVVSAIAEAHRLSHGHLLNPVFASETSRIDPLPHQRLAVYNHMLQQSPLRFLLADDAGAGKTIMTGLYVREMLTRRLLHRILIVPPAGLLGNWEREMRNLFRLQFKIIRGADARSGNPFASQESDLAIVSVDTLAGEHMFNCLRGPETEPYDLVVFDEAHKLSANHQPDFRIHKTDRYRLAEAIAGAGADGERWKLPWSALHLLLLTATPHMGKDSPYYFLWRLLLPETLATHDAFDTFPSESRQRHFIRRTKEEMVHFDGSPIYPERICATLSYDLTSGPGSEQELYDETTDYIRNYYNRAQFLNRSAVRLAMTVFQRRLASSTYALMRSLERRAEKLETLMELIRDGTLSEEQLAQQQRQLDTTEDVFEARTADEQLATDGAEQEEEFEETALEATVGVSLAELKDEHLRVRALVSKAQTLFAQGEESKFEKLQELLSDPDYAEEKFIIFTEHRDTVDFLIRRLEGLGFTGQVASIHGGMPYQERERQVELFRQSKSEYGSRFLVATDAAGEGINLQFCWLMVNYDIPWNPARLEQRMGRIHRYGQTHNPVVVTNLVAGATREGRVLRILLEKLDNIRTQLASDKVFDVVGRLLEGVSIKDYLERALEEGNTDSVVERIDKLLTTDRVRDVQDGDSRIFGPGGEVASKLERLNDDMEQEAYRRLLPGYARRFVERVAPLLDLEIKGDLEATFRLTPGRPGALDAMLPALEAYDEDSREHLTVYRPDDDSNKIWLHPGEPVFDRLSSLTIGRFSNSGLRGSVFTDPYSTSPYLFHIALITVEQLDDQAITSSEEMIRLRDSRLVGLRQTRDGVVEECPLEHLLLLKGLENFPVGSETLAATARNLVAGAEEFAKAVVASRLAEFHRQEVLNTLKDRLDFVSRGFNYRATELAKRWNHLNERIQSGDQPAAEELTLIREQQRGLSAVRDRRLDSIRAEPGNIQPGSVEFLVHALVVPSQDPEEMESYDADVESIAVEVATAYEKGLKAEVKDVSRPVMARQAGLTDWPGFDLLSRRPRTSDSPAQALAIEVKGRRGRGGIELQDNEWATACNLRGKYWLYVVFDCATPHPRLVRVRDPFGKLLAKTRESTALTITESQILEAAE